MNVKLNEKSSSNNEKIEGQNATLGNKKIPVHAFKPGNKYGKGREVGSKSKTQLAIEQIGFENAKGVLNKVVESALEGDMQASKLILERVMPVRKGTRFKLNIPYLSSLEDLENANKEILRMMADAEISPEEALSINENIELRRQIIQLYESEKLLREATILLKEMKNDQSK